jgi:hypothetical protein
MNETSINELKEEIIKLKNENEELKNQLYIYTKSQKEYYNIHKHKVIDKANERLKKLSIENPEKLKEYRRTAYQNRKLKLLNTQL